MHALLAGARLGKRHHGAEGGGRRDCSRTVTRVRGKSRLADSRAASLDKSKKANLREMRAVENWPNCGREERR